MKEFALVTVCNAKFGDFLADHWYRSLKENVNLEKIDVIIFDYGLTDVQRQRLNGAIIVPYVLDGHITSVRYRDLLTFLNQNQYDQVAMCDGGDIIFQSDISEIFVKGNPNFKGVQENPETLQYNLQFYFDKFKSDYRNLIAQGVKDKKIINGGLIVGNAEKVKVLCRRYLDMVIDLKSYGPDQIGMAYLAYEMGFEPIDMTYNFCMVSFYNIRFMIKNHEFYFADGRKVKVVHNGGGLSFFRPIKNFGYGQTYNRVGLIYYLGPVLSIIWWNIIKLRYVLLNLNK